MNREHDEGGDSHSDGPFDGIGRGDWDEDDWEYYLSRQDVLNAKYDELYETLHDHPDRDELIAQEMDWNLPEDIFGEYACEDDESDEESDRFDEELAEIPAFLMAQDYALELERQVTARLRERVCGDEDAGPAAQAARRIVAALAGGHGIGYERDALCGNIACCKRALAVLEESLEGVHGLRRRGTLPPADADRLTQRAEELGRAIAQRIDDLRLRVWWR